MEKVFVIGDSRTGTTSLHKFLLDLGYNSIHYYVDVENLVLPIHTDYEGNWQRLRNFYLTTSYNAFSDFPTRFYYKEIFELFPNAYFILSMRESVETWQKSMRKYFIDRGKQIDLKHLTNVHIDYNEKIKKLFAAHPEARFLELVIDANSDENSNRLKAFLNKSSSPATLRKLNSSNAK